MNRRNLLKMLAASSAVPLVAAAVDESTLAEEGHIRHLYHAFGSRLETLRKSEERWKLRLKKLRKRASIARRLGFGNEARILDVASDIMEGRHDDPDEVETKDWSIAQLLAEDLS